MSKLFTISPSPHVHGDESVKKIMYGVIFAMLPALALSFFFFGMDALRVSLVAVVSCLLFEYLIQKFLMKGEVTIFDGSAAITGILLAFNVPAGLPTWLVALGALVSIGIGKMSFGGLGQNPFNPALVGRVFLLISFPVQMTSWVPNRGDVDGFSGATPLALIKEAVHNGVSLKELSTLPSSQDLFYGYIPGSMGEISAAALLLGGLYMLVKKIISWHTPVAVLGSIFIFSGILWMVNPDQFIDPMFHILSGGAMLGAIFMATDMVSSPMIHKGQIIFGIGIGVITVCIRTWGAYPEGISFAILIMNGFTPLINTYVKPKRFGGAK